MATKAAGDGNKGDAHVDVDKVKPYSDDELDTKGEDRGDGVTDADLEGGEENVDDETPPAGTKKKSDAAGDDEGPGDEEEDGGEEETESVGERDTKGRFAKRPTLTVPKARLDEALKRTKEAEDALAEMAQLLDSEQEEADGGQASMLDVLETEIVDLEKARAKALKDGDEEKLVELSGAIRQRERQISRLEATSLSEVARARAREEVRADLVIDKLEESYPVLNPASEDYDEDIVNEIRVLRNGLVREGVALSEAIVKASNYVLRGLEPAGEKKTAKKGPSVREKIEEAKKQPTNLSKTRMGADHDKAGRDLATVDVGKLSDADFEKLPESTRKRLRGDLV